MTQPFLGLYGSFFAPSRRACAAFALSLSLAAPLAPQPPGLRSADTRYGYLRAATIGEVVDLWHPETHLYVIGDVRLGEDALRDLATYLEDTHWTILLVQDATGQTYPDSNGQMRYGNEAIEHATRQGIRQRYGFAEQLHPLTQERDGAVFSIVIVQRALFYAASEAQDSRGLGADHFENNLDRSAIVRLRSGDIAAAVRATVLQISSRLDASLDSVPPKDWVEEAVVRLDFLERLSRELRRRSPDAFRNLQLPVLDHLRAEVDTARQARDAGDVREAWRRLSYVLDQTGSAVQALQTLQQNLSTARSELQGAATAVAGLEEAVAGLRQAFPELQGPLVRPDIERLRQALASAEAGLENDPARTARTAAGVAGEARAQIESIADYPKTGDALDFAEARLLQLERHRHASEARGQLLTARRRLAAARQLHMRGEPGYRGAFAAASTALATAERRIAKAEVRAALRSAAGLSLLFLLATAGFALNRRRRGVKREAQQLLAEWRAALGPELGALLDKLEQRAALFVGPASGEGKHPHAGETLRLADEIRADLGSLRVLWNSASGVVHQAGALIQGRWLAAAYNLFLPGKYRQGIALLEAAQPLQEIVAQLSLRTHRVAEALDLVEWSVLHGTATLDETGKRIRGTRSRREALEFAGFADGLFLVPAVFTAALPAAASALARARSQLSSDPVGALQGAGATARRMVQEASQLAELVAASRNGVLPAIEASVAALRQAGVSTDWIEAARIELSERADRLASRAAEETIAGGIEELGRDLADLGSWVERAVAQGGVHPEDEMNPIPPPST